MLNLDDCLHPINYILIMLASSILGIFCIIYYHRERERESNDINLHKSVFIIILCFGLVASFITPLWSNFDESEHFVRAELTSRGELIPTFDSQMKTYSTIKSVKDLVDDQQMKTIFNTDVDTSRINYSPSNVGSAFAQNPFYAYLFPGFGVFLAKILNLNTIWMLWLGRIFNLILYAFLSAYAVRKSPILKMPLIAVACLPLSIYLGASQSIDSLINGLGLVIVAYFFYMFKASDKSIQMKEILFFFFLCLLIGLCKVPYFALSFLILLVHIKKFKYKKYYLFCILGIIILGLIAILWSKGYAIPRYNESYRGDLLIKNGVDLNAQLLFIRDHVNDFIIIILQIGNYLPGLFNGLFFCNISHFWGSKLINVTYPIFLVSIFFLYPMKTFIKLKSRTGGFLVIGILFIGTYIIQLLTWTPVGQLYHIEGVQNRYFIPLIGLLPFVFGINNQNNSNEKIDSIIMTIVIGFIATWNIMTVICCY
ncbi:MAG: DUF2142 domain-containing protein [Methanobrevibacter sp.]|nr:DUF2142 domain-containing protein [Candidatus Methanovirga procula]